MLLIKGALDRLHYGEDATGIRDSLISHGRELFGDDTWSNAGCESHIAGQTKFKPSPDAKTDWIRSNSSTELYTNILVNEKLQHDPYIADLQALLRFLTCSQGLLRRRQARIESEIPRANVLVKRSVRVLSCVGSSCAYMCWSSRACFIM